MIEIEYGEDKDTYELIHISKAIRGKQCNCICSCCGSLLVAAKGDVVQHHFKHYNNKECAGVGETQAHLMAKEVIKNEGIYIPNIINDIYNKMGFCANYYNQNTNKYNNYGNHVFFDEVMVEKRYQGMIPDIIGIKDGVRFLIEVAVTHFVDKKKQEKIDKSGADFCLEIKVNKDKDITIESIRAQLNNNKNVKFLKVPLIFDEISKYIYDFDREYTLISFIKSSFSHWVGYGGTENKHCHKIENNNNSLCYMSKALMINKGNDLFIETRCFDNVLDNYCFSIIEDNHSILIIRNGGIDKFNDIYLATQSILDDVEETRINVIKELLMKEILKDSEKMKESFDRLGNEDNDEFACDYIDWMCEEIDFESLQYIKPTLL